MDYKQELFAQCTPYLQWLKDRKADGSKKQKDTGKPIDAFPFSSCMDSVRKVLGGQADKERNYLFVNRDGRLQEGACERIAQVFSEHEEAMLVYADEDYYGTLEALYQINEHTFEKAVISEFKEPENGLYRGEPWLKPDFSPDTLEAFFYIGNIFAVRGQVIAESLETCGEEISLYGLAKAVSHQITGRHDEQRQDERRQNEHCRDEYRHDKTHGADVFVHIPEVLFTNNRLSQKDELDGWEQDACEKNDIVWLGGRHAALGRLSVIIPSKDNPQVLRRCIETFEQCAKNMDYELIIVDNGSSDENRVDICNFLGDHRANYLYEKAEFNFSHMCNIGAKAANGDFLLFLNDDIEVGASQQGGQWLSKMMRYAAMEHVGAVGIKLHYPDSGLIQHAGITNMGIGPAHKLGGMPDKGNLYHGHNLADYNMLAVTAACMMISREKFERAGGFDEALAVAYNDVELCFRLYQMGLYNVQVNSAFLIHHESLSRGEDTAPEKQARLMREKQKLYEKHAWASPKAQAPDPFYSPNLVQWEKDAAYHINYQYPFDKPVELKRLSVDLKPFSKNAKAFRPLTRWFLRRMVQSNLKQISAPAAKLYSRLTGENRHMLHIDQITQEDGLVTITGWHVLQRRDNAKLAKKLWIFDPHWNLYEAELSPKLRRDVEALFVEERHTKNTALSGFCVKFYTDGLIKGKYCIGIVVACKRKRQFMVFQENHLEV